MRVLDIIKENQDPLTPLTTVSGATSYVNRLNARANQTSYIKQQLARHRLVTGYRNGQFIKGGMAWPANQIDGTWTPQLDAAITAWKRSINIQMTGNDRGPLDVNPSAPGITRQDRQYLVGTELGSDGLLDANASGGLAAAAPSNPGQLSNMTYSETIPGNREQVAANPTSDTVYNAVGWSAWYRISAEILESQLSTDSESWLATTSPSDAGQAIIGKMRRTFESNRTAQVSGQWLSNISTQSRRAVATYADGTEQPIDITSKLGPSPQAVDIFDYYSNMALKLWEKDRQTTAQARQTADEVAASPVSATTLDDPTLRAMAAQLEAAFENRLTAIFPGGRSPWNDVEAIQSILGRLRTAADFDNLSSVYTEVSGGEILHEQLYEELKRDDYMSIVVPKLLSIRRISPRILYTNIEFGDADEVPVTFNGRNYKIQQGLGPEGNPVIQGYDSSNDYDAIVIDGILRAGVEATGGNLPDFDAPVGEEALLEAQLAFINNIQITYPEMVPFYVRAEPFDAASVDIGGSRLRGIVEDAARMGGDQAAMASFITQEILSDRTWLIGTEDTEPAASIEFDERWETEGIRGRDFPAVSADDDVELNANEEEIFENLKSPQAGVVRAAVDALLQSDDPAQMWENIYREAASQNLWLDEAANMGDGQRDVEEFLTGRDPGTNIIRVVRSVGLAIAAPRVCAKMFYDAGKGRLGTDKETIDALIAQIRDRYDYEMIDERYRQVGGDDSLIDDLASEQFQGLWGGGWYGALAAKIGDEDRLELIRAEIPRRVMDTLQDVERAPSNDTIQNLRRAIGREDLTEDQMSLIVERLQETVSDMAESGERLLLINFIGEIEPAQSTPEIPDYFSP